MPSLDHLATERAGLGDNALTNAYVLKMIETMRGYHEIDGKKVRVHAVNMKPF